VHVSGSEGEAKLWLVPDVEIAINHGLSSSQVSEILQVVKVKRDELFESWRRHFAD
jgi:hypothetical protein